MGAAQKFLQRLGFHQLSPTIRRFFIGIIGTTIVLLGLLMIFLPGPGSLVIFGGLAILATEFVWARRLIKRGKAVVQKVERSVRS